MTTQVKPDQDKFFIVGIGASAGGVQALEAFFDGLPDNPNGAFVVVQHLSPNHRSMMTEILQRQTSLPVQEVQDQMLLEPAHVYVLPPGQTLFLEEQRLRLEASSESPRYPINRFFQSLVDGWGERTIAILLSGTGNDGTEGLQAVSRAGGVALVQSPETAQFTSMPTSAIPSGLVDEVLSPQDLAQTVYELIRFSDNFPTSKVNDANSIDPDQLQQILDILAEREEIDFSHYKVSTLSRRIHHRCALIRQDSIANYIDFLEASEEEQKLLRQDLLIGATCFFRDPEAWEFLERYVLTQCIEQLEPQQQLRIWVSACATGEEAYSMAILVDEVMQRASKPVQAKIFATDLDTNALEVAAQGIYPESIANSVSPERLERYFDYHGNHYQVKRSLREMLIIAPHDLTKNAGFSRMNLVSCRNVLIYMQPQLQQQVLRLLHFALGTQGTLFLGSSETLGNLSEEFTVSSPKWKIFQKRRDTQLSLMPISRQVIFTPIRGSGQTKARQQQLDRLLGEVFEICLAERKVTCVLVSAENLVLRVFYNAARLLEYPLGESNLDITEIIHPALKLPLSTALHRARRDQEAVLYTGLKVEQGDEELNVLMRVGPDKTVPMSNQAIVVFEIERQSAPAPAALRFDVDQETAQQITELEYELQQTRENLQVTIEELETANEEQQATNEELLASNEELQSTNEELQSVNEELYTVNAEYQSKIQELTQLNNDIDNLLRSTDIGVIFLDVNLNIRKFTPAATRSVNVKAADIGRPLTDLTNSLDCPNLLDILEDVNRSKQSQEHEVRIEQSNRYVLMRVHPYAKDNGNSGGVVITFVSVSELKQVQNQLQQANIILENLYKTSPVGLSLHNEELKFLRVNQTLAQMSGAAIEEHIGKTPQEVLPELATQIEPMLRRVVESGAPIYNAEIFGTTPTAPDRERFWTANYYPVNFLQDGQGVGSVIVEITDRVLAEQALQKSREKLIEAQRLAQVGNWELELHPDLDVLSARADWSAEIFRIYGLDPQQPSLSFAELLQYHPPADQAQFRNALELLVSRRIPFSIDVQLTHADEEPHYLNLIGQAIRNSADQAIKLYGTVMDITARKKIEKELVRKNAALEEAITIAQTANSANQAKSEFLANMSHEIRTPMNAISVTGQLLQQTEMQPRQQQLLQTLANNTQRLLTLIDNILDLSKLEARELQLENRPFRVEDTFRLLSSSLTPQAENKDLSITFEVAPDVPEQLLGDDFRLQQVLTNLIGNAIKFTPSGTITVTAAYQAEANSEAENSVMLIFRVQDTGIGVDTTRQNDLFQPFVQADTSTTRQFGGTGLGLTICRRIVQTMGGEIGVQSEPEQGSTFWFTVPLTIAPIADAATDLPESMPPPVTLSAAVRSALRLLIIEDNEDNRDVLLMLLDSIGYEADAVVNGQDFLDRTAEQDYDIVLMDCQMPVVDGYEATRRLRQREGEQKHTIVIGVTAHAMESDRQKCLDAGMDDYLTKPIELEQLANTLQRWINP